MATPTVRGEGLTPLLDELRDINRRLETLERPDATQKGSLVAQVQTALANLNAQVAAAISANSYTRAQIDAKIASPGAISPTDVTASGTGSFTTALKSTGAYNTDVSALSGARQQVWQHNTGVYGYAPSSITKKTNLGPVPFTADDVLAITPHVFQYKAQLALADDDPDYEAPWEIGLIAEELITHNMGCFVFWEDDGITPRGINYDLFGAIAPLVVIRELSVGDEPVHL